MDNKTKTCPYCGSEIPVNVKKCKFCGEWLVTQEKDKPKFSMHLDTIIEVIIVILSIPIGLHLGTDSALGFMVATYIVLNLYFLPTLIADGKRTQYTLAILALNLLLGVTIIGWIGALIWALVLPNLSKNIDNTDNDSKSDPLPKTSNNNFQKLSTLKMNTLEKTNETKQCPYCAELIPKNSTYCNVCKTSLNNIYSNNSAQIKPANNQFNDEIPNNLKQWNWGAFWLTWIWGIGNKSWLTFWALIPYFGIIWMFVCGSKGNEWAWKNKSWTSIEEFTQVQRKWTIIGNILAATLIILITIVIILCMGE